MTNFRRYFRAHLKESIIPMIYIFSVVLFFTVLVGMNMQTSYYYGADGQVLSVREYESTIGTPVTFLYILIYVLPVMEFSFFKKRINLDCAYALPISRRAMGAVRYLTGLLILFGAFTLSYLLNFFLLLRHEPGWFHFSPMIPHYFLSLLLGIAIYSVMVFVFSEANTKGEGIWLMIFYSFVFFLVAWALGDMLPEGNIFARGNLGTPLDTLNALTTRYRYMIEVQLAQNTFWEPPKYVGWLVFWVVLGVASAVGFFLGFGKKRTEKTGEISTSCFGFASLLPVCAVSAMIAFEVANHVLAWAMLEVLVLLGYTVYRRGFHYKKSDVAVLLSLVIFLFLKIR